MKYRTFTLDKFQEDAVKALDKNHSVVVSAPTGSGKTLIADYLIDKELKKGQRIIYTAPIKALSNQKFQEFCESFGASNIGILTGDVVVNPTAPVLIMTTEIYRNMLLAQDPSTQDIHFVIFDEIHYITDIERGHVWEESIIFSPEQVRFLCLSATIPNAKDFAEWIETIQEHKVDTVTHTIRSVPLSKEFYDSELGITDLDRIISEKKKSQRSRKNYFKNKHKGPRPPSHKDLVKLLRRKKHLPMIYFVFSRAKTQMLGEQLGRVNDFLDPQEKTTVVHAWRDIVSKDKQLNKFKTTLLLRELLSKGIAFHHAGLLPPLKKIVEYLFSLGIIKVLYATETFAVGLNMPAKTVAFDSLEKFDGINFRYMNSKEYFQLAGRAGRRGIDKEGRAIAMINRQYDDLERIKTFTQKDVDPLFSQFRLSYNTVLNLIDQHDDDEIVIILRKSFDFYLRYGPKAYKEAKANPLKAVFTKRRKELVKWGYVLGNELTDKGKFAANIYSNEIKITEIFFSGFTDNLSTNQIILLVSSLMFEGRRGTRFKPFDEIKEAKQLAKKVYDNKMIRDKKLEANILKLSKTVYEWVGGCHFVELLTLSNLQEGDLIRLFRQVIDVLSQVRRASANSELNNKLDDAMDLLNREYVEVKFE